MSYKFEIEVEKERDAIRLILGNTSNMSITAMNDEASGLMKKAFVVDSLADTIVEEL